MANKKRRFSKRAYLDYFSKDASGGFTYTGGYYALQGGGYKALSVRLAVFAAVAAVCTVVCGCLPGIIDVFYVILPYVAEVGFTGSVVYAVLRFLTNAKPLREYVYSATVAAFPWRALLAAAFAGAGVIAGTVFFILNGVGNVWLTAAFYVCKAASVVCMLLVRRAAKSSVWTLSKTDAAR